MIDKAKVLALYDDAIARVKDVNNPLIHLSSEKDAERYGAAMLERVRALGGSVLDIGCNVASPLKYFDEITLRSMDYTGLDLNENALRLARERWQGFSNLKFAQYDISSCNLAQNFDIIFVNETFSYFDAAEICAMIDYYASRANKLFSTSIFTDNLKHADWLLIEQTQAAPIINHVLRSYPLSIVNRATYPQRLRIDILS